ncbi:MAG: hypothetical protein FWC47_06080 [Oscillospiraceae bacterium]|nr:hypothetical protein [Oscillospiraceae bacterium]
MDTVNIVFTFSLENNKTYNFTIKDVSALASANEIKAVGLKLIEKGSKYNNSLFKSLISTKKQTIIEEIL